MGDVTSNQLKRKRTLSSSDVDDVDELIDTEVSLQNGDDDQRLRRRVFELSLAKVRMAAPLTQSLRRREPPLLRSVLILNTLRSVDPVRVFSEPAPPTIVAPSTPYRSPSVLDELPGSLLFGDGRPLATPALTDENAVSCSILDDLFGCERTSTGTSASSSPPILTFSSLFDLDCASVWPPSMPAASPPSLPSSSSSMEVDVDLDVGLLDFDLLQPAAMGHAGSRTPLSSHACGQPGSTAGVLATSTCTQRSQMFFDELERIAQILVGT